MAEITIRQSQIAHTYATGSIGDFPGVSAMFLTHDHEQFDWGKPDYGNQGNKRRIIKDKRLTDAFGIENFVLPPLVGLGTNTLKVVRFPISLYCPACGRIHFVPDLEKYNNGLIPKNKGGLITFDSALRSFYCTDCLQEKITRRVELVPTRFIIANLEGFIEDFPWDWYVHRKPEKRKERGKGHKLYLEFTSSSASLGSINLLSKDQNGKTIAFENLSEIFDQDKTFLSKGDEYLPYVGNKMSKPWLGRDGNEFIKELIADVPKPDQIIRDGAEHVIGENAETVKRKYPRTLQRGANNLFFPLVFKGIRLPASGNEYDQQLINLISSLKKSFTDNQPDIYRNYTNEQWHFKFKTDLRGLLSCNDETLSGILNSLYPKDTGYENSIEKKQQLRMEEFKCFSDKSILKSDKIWYKARHINISDEFLKNKVKINGITLLDKINELKIFRGFTRIKPLSNEDLIFETSRENLEGRRLDEYNRICDARKYPFKTNELPSAEVKGEGIFLLFDNEALNTWERKESVLLRYNQMKNNLSIYFGTFGIVNGIEKINPRYVFLHTFSHIIMQQLANDSGYSLSSLTEIIYTSIPNDKEEMNGILIYTSSSDTEGTLGGLVEKGEENLLSPIISKAIDRAKWCSSDPLCITSVGQGFMTTNMAACYSCVMVPETCCENINKFLDRKLVLDFFEIETL